MAGLVVTAMAIGGCASAPKPDIEYVALPTREVQANFAADFGRVHAACMRVVLDELHFQTDAIDRDEGTGRSRITANKHAGASLRITLERSRDLASTTVKVFAVEAGAAEASANAARDVLNRISDDLWPAK